MVKSARRTPSLTGLGKGHVAGLRIDRDGAVWAGTEGGLSRIKDGRIATLTTKNGLPCDAIHWSIEDDDGALWLYTALRSGTHHAERTGSVDRRPERVRLKRQLWDAGGRRQA